MARWLGKILARQVNIPPPVGFFVSPTGSATGAGTIGDPWTLAQAFLGGFPTTAIQPGDTVWLREGTYVGEFTPAVSGTVTDPVVFRSYPGERASLDSQTVASPQEPVVRMSQNDSYYWIRNVEVLNSGIQPTLQDPDKAYGDVLSGTILNSYRWATLSSTSERGDGFLCAAPNSKIINCIVHDTGQGFATVNNYGGIEIYGNLIYHNGFFNYLGESGDHGTAVDLVDDGTAVALNAQAAQSATNSNTAALTFNATGAGDYMVVVAHTYDTSAPDYTSMTATFNGAAMTQIGGRDSSDPHGVRGCIGIFGIASPAAGSHNVVVSYPESHAMSSIAKCFDNVASATAEGGWDSSIDLFPPFTSAATSATGHMVIDCAYFYGAYGVNYHASGDNTGKEIATQGEGGGPFIRMSWASGAANVAMSWDWDPDAEGHGHGFYFHSGKTKEKSYMDAGSDILKMLTPGLLPDFTTPQFVASDVGEQIMVQFATGVPTALLTTITEFHSGAEVRLANVATDAIAGRKSSWGTGNTLRDNIVLDTIGQMDIQCTGTGDAATINATVSGNLWMRAGVYFGQSTYVWQTGSVWDGNWNWQTGLAWVSVNDLRDFTFTNNYHYGINGPPTTAEATLSGNTFIGTNTITEASWPGNTYYDSPDVPTTNIIVVKPNVYKDAYDPWYGWVYVYNWEGLSSVSVDLSSIVSAGTSVEVRNAADIFDAAPVWSGTYSGGTVSLAMTGLTRAEAIGYPTDADPTGPGFNVFIVTVPGGK